jgi:ribokinase
MAGPLVVLGAINVDLVVTGAGLPGPGETVVGGDFRRHHGGKGGNQAVAAARAGAEVAIVGAVGADAFGDEALAALRAEGVDVAHVRRADAHTGVALIVVDAAGENQISVAPGANRLVEDPRPTLDELEAAVVLASCEVPLDAVRSAAAWCRQASIPFVVNPAPAGPGVRELLAGATVTTPNEGELAALAPDLEATTPRAFALATAHAGLAVVVTKGADGAVVIEARGATTIEAPAVERVVDTTGAGDCFNGVLAAGLWERRELAESVHRAVVAASVSVEVAGAREGMPPKARIDELAGDVS